APPGAARADRRPRLKLPTVPASGLAISRQLQARRTRKKEQVGFPTCPTRPAFPTCPAASEREPQADLAAALLRTTEVAGIPRRREQLWIRIPGRRDDHARPEAARVDRVEQVEHLADRLDARAPTERELLREADVQLLL